MCSVMMLSSLMRKLLNLIRSVDSQFLEFPFQLKNLFFGAFEFAKRFCVKGGRVDLSAMSAPSFFACLPESIWSDGYM